MSSLEDVVNEREKQLLELIKRKAEVKKEAKDDERILKKPKLDTEDNSSSTQQNVTNLEEEIAVSNANGVSEDDATNALQSDDGNQPDVAKDLKSKVKDQLDDLAMRTDSSIKRLLRQRVANEVAQGP